MEADSAKPSARNGDWVQETPAFEFPPKYKLTFVNVCGFEEIYPCPEDMPGLKSGLLHTADINWKRHSYRPSDLLAEDAGKDMVTSAAHSLLEDLQKACECKGSNLAIFAVDIGATIVKEALSLAASDPLYKHGDILHRICLLAIFGSLHQAKTTSELVAVISHQIRMCCPDKTQSNISPETLVKLAEIHSDVAERFDKAEKPYQIVNCFQQCGPESPHTLVVTEPCARTLSKDEIGLGLDRSYLQLCEVVGDDEKEYWRLQVEAACIRKLDVYQEVIQALHFGAHQQLPRSLQTCRNLAEHVLARESMQDWTSSSGHWEDPLYLSFPPIPVRSDILGHELSFALHDKINTKSRFQPVILHLDVMDADPGHMRRSAACEAYASLCTQLLSQHPGLTMKLRDFELSQLKYAKGQMLYFTLSRQLRGLLMKLLSCEETGRETYITININVPPLGTPGFVGDIIQTLSLIMASTDSKVMVVLLEMAKREDPVAFARFGPPAAQQMSTEKIDDAEFTIALDKDITEWLALSSASGRISNTGEMKSVTFQWLKNSATWLEVDQFFAYSQQTNECLDFIPSTLSKKSEGCTLASALTTTIRLHGDWLLVALFWIFHASRPLTLDELDDAVSFDLTLRPELMSVLCSAAVPSCEAIRMISQYEPIHIRSMVAKDVMQVIPGAITVDNGRVFPLDNQIRQILADAKNLKPMSSSTPAAHIALSCLLRTRYELFKFSESNVEGNNATYRAETSKLTEYAFLSWTKHYLVSVPPYIRSAGDLQQYSASIPDTARSLEIAVAAFLSNLTEVERWLKLISLPVAKWPSLEVIDGIPLEDIVLPNALQHQLKVPIGHAACLSAILVTRLDTWNHPYDSLLLGSLEDMEDYFRGRPCLQPMQNGHTYRAETIAQVFVTQNSEAWSKEVFDRTPRSRSIIFSSLDQTMNLYSMASLDTSLVHSLISDSTKHGHLCYILRVASQLGDVWLVERILSNLQHGVGKDDRGVLPLGHELVLIAALSGQIEVVKKCLEFNKLANLCTESGLNSIMLASMNGFTEIVRLLVENGGIEINAKSPYTGDSALHLASRSGFRNTVKVLLDHGADVLMSNSSDDLPLHLALTYGHEEVAKILVDNTQIPEQVALGTAPVRVFTTVESDDEVENTDTDTESSDSRSDDKADLDSGRSATPDDTDSDRSKGQLIHPFNIIGSSGANAFELAARRGYVSVCEAMARKNINIHFVDDDGISALQHAAKIGSVELVDFLLNQKLDSTIKGDDLLEPLTQAAQYGHVAVARRLLASNSDLINKLDNGNSFTPLDRAVQYKHRRVVELLVNELFKAAPTHSALTMALVRAAGLGDISMVECLLDLGVDVNNSDDRKNTALHFSAYFDYAQLTQVLIVRGARLECSDNGGYRPVMDAARTGSLSSLKVLINAGADLEALTDKGSSALDLAIDNIKVECARLLVEKLSRRGYAWNKLSHGKIREVVQFAANHFNDKTATSMLRDVLEKDSDKLESSSAKEFISSLLWDKFSKIVELVWDGWDISALELGPYGTVLHYAAMRHQFGLVETILTRTKHPVQVDIQNGSHNTALKAAIVTQPKADDASSFLDTIDILIRHNSDITAAGEDGILNTLQAAVWNRHRGLVNKLLEALEPGIIRSSGGQFGTVLQALLAYPYDETDEAADVAEWSFKRLMDIGESVMRAEGHAELTGLHRAAHCASMRMVKLVMEQEDVNIFKVDRMGRLPIHLAVSLNLGRDKWDIILAMDPDLKTLWKEDTLKRSILHLAAGTGAIGVLENILEVAKKSSPGLDLRELLNKEDIDGWTPLHWACRSVRNGKKVVKLLIDNGADKKKKTNKPEGWLPGHVAIYHNSDHPKLKRSALHDSEDYKNLEELPTEAAMKTQTFCDSCACSNRGDAWHCVSCSEECAHIEFDLCFKCYPHKEKIHPESHAYQHLTDTWYSSYHHDRRVRLGLENDDAMARTR